MFWFVKRLIAAIEEGDCQGATFEQLIFYSRGEFGGGIEFQLNPGQGLSLSNYKKKLSG